MTQTAPTQHSEMSNARFAIVSTLVAVLLGVIAYKAILHVRYSKVCASHNLQLIDQYCVDAKALVPATNFIDERAGF